MTSFHPKQNARTVLTSRLEAGSWDRETLVETTVALDDFERDVVEDALEDLVDGGLYYLDDGEVKQ